MTLDIFLRLPSNNKHRNVSLSFVRGMTLHVCARLPSCKYIITSIIVMTTAVIIIL
jgi:hypothetical protein